MCYSPNALAARTTALGSRPLSTHRATRAADGFRSPSERAMSAKTISRSDYDLGLCTMNEWGNQMRKEDLDLWQPVGTSFGGD